MAFSNKNYWEQGNSPRDQVLAMLAAASGNGEPTNPNPVQGIGGMPVGNFGSVVAGEAPKADPATVARVMQQQQGPNPTPNPPPEDDLSRLVKEVVDMNKSNPAVYPWNRPWDSMDLINANSPYLPGTNAVLKPSMAPASTPHSNPWDVLKNVAGNVMKGGTDAGIAGLLKNVGSNVLSAADGVAQDLLAQQNDPMSLYEKLRQSTPGYSYQGPSAKEMADAQFNPLFQMLDAQSKQDEARYNTGAARAKQSYAGFVNGLIQDAKANQATYAGAGKTIGASGDAAAKSVTDNATRSAQALSKELQQLGIQEGADTLFAKNQGNLTQALGRINENRQTAADLNTGLGASAAVADRGTQATARQAGLNYQADLYDNYLNQLNQNDQQRLQLQGQRGQAEGNYNMQIQKLLADNMGQREDSITNIFKAMTDNNFRQQQLQLDQQRFGLDQDKFGLDVQKSGINNDKSNNAYRTLQSSAKQYFGNDQDAAVAANTLLNALRQAPNATDMGTLLAQIPEEELRKPYMADLAYTFFNSVLNNKGL